MALCPQPDSNVTLVRKWSSALTSHSAPRIRTPPGPISSEWEKAETGITKSATAAAAQNANFRIACNIPDPPVGVCRRILADAAGVIHLGSRTPGWRGPRTRRRKLPQVSPDLQRALVARWLSVLQSDPPSLWRRSRAQLTRRPPQSAAFVHIGPSLRVRVLAHRRSGASCDGGSFIEV